MPRRTEKFRTRLYESTEETVNKKTGEVTRVRKRYGIKVKSENFYFTYIDNLSGYLKVTGNIDKSVLAYFCMVSEFDTGRVFLSAKDRKELCATLDISSQQMSNSISILKQLKLITGERGFYTINPAVYWKGTSKEREKLLMDNAVAVEFNFYIEEENPSKDIPINENF